MNCLTILLTVLLWGGMATAQTVTTLVSGSTFNDGLALDREGNVYASMYYGTTVTKITPQGQASIFATGLSSPNGLTFGPDGNLYVPNASGGTVTKVLPDGTGTTYLSITDPATIMFNSDGSFLVTHYNEDKISLVDASLGVTDFLVGGELDGPIGLVRDAGGVLYIGNFNDGRIFRFIPGTGLELIGDLPGWLGFMTLAGDAIYATGWQVNRIYKVPLDGSGAVIFAGTGAAGGSDGPVGSATFNNPNGIVASSTGDTLFVSDYTSRSLRMITGVNQTTSVGEGTGVVGGFRLDQNYPNPFNPGTTISFTISQSSFINLAIYDLVGREVATLVHERLSPGRYTQYWDAAGLSAGVYYYRLTTGSSVETRRLVLLR